MTFQTPILLITFNRPEHTAKVLVSIKKQRPERMFVFRDGPRLDFPDDAQKCSAVDKLILREIDWDCELETCIEPKNLGCGYGPAKAITWFFDQVEQGIVLEDDCLPSDSFFDYCEVLLDRYRDDNTIYMITGTNPLKRWRRGKASYLYAYMGNSLGWASWRRAWEKFDYALENWGASEGKITLKNNVGSVFFDHFADHFEQIYQNKPSDIWDFQWLFARWAHGGKTIVPAKNLISNIGFNELATHSKNENDQLANLPVFELKPPFIPPSRHHDHFFDWMAYERFVNPEPRSFLKKIILKTAKIWTGTN
jgi:hypothetical protein